MKETQNSLPCVEMSCAQDDDQPRHKRKNAMMITLCCFILKSYVVMETVYTSSLQELSLYDDLLGHGAFLASDDKEIDTVALGAHVVIV